jgi:hypothetical protein
MNKNINIFILVLISLIFLVLILRYTNTLIHNVTEFFSSQQDNSVESESNVSTDSSFLNYTNSESESIESENNSTFPIGGLDVNESCPHYDGQYYAFDNTCRPCNPGEYVDYKSKKCVLCPKDNFSEHRNSLKCSPCPYGTVTNNLMGQIKCNKPFSTKQQLRTLIGKNHDITIDRVKQQKLQNIELKSIQNQMDDMMESLESIKYSSDSSNLDQHKKNQDLIKAAETGSK